MWIGGKKNQMLPEPSQASTSSLKKTDPIQRPVYVILIDFDDFETWSFRVASPITRFVRH